MCNGQLVIRYAIPHEIMSENEEVTSATSSILVFLSEICLRFTWREMGTAFVLRNGQLIANDMDMKMII